MKDEFINQDLESKFFHSTDLRLKSVKDGILRIGPEHVRFGISRSCNFNCVTCWNYSPLRNRPKPKKWGEAKIDKELVLNTLDELVLLNCTAILFSGAGEPFTHPNMMDFIRRAKEHNMIVRIQTNLSLLESPVELAKHLRSQADLVCVHLSAATPETYSKVHPNQPKEQFYRTLDKIKKLRKENVSVRLVYIVNKLNYKEISEAFFLNKYLKTRLHLEMMDFVRERGLEKVALREAEKKEVIHNLFSFKMQNEYRLKSNVDDFINQIQYSCLGLKKINSCALGYFYSIIDESGNVLYCYNNDPIYWMGNLKNRSFHDIWFSSRYNKLRLKCLRGQFLKSCQTCTKERSMNFKVRMYIKPSLRNFELEKILVGADAISKLRERFKSK